MKNFLLCLRDMNGFLFLPPALLLGLVIGAWTPHAELRVVRQEVASLKTALANQTKDSRISTITRMMRIPDRATKPPKAQAADAGPPASPDGMTNAVAEAASQNAASPGDPNAWPVPEFSPDDLRARLEEAKDLWATRAQLARSQWLSRLKLSPEEAASFDAAIDAMNAELFTTIQGLAGLLAADQEMTPELGARYLNEVADTLVRTYDSFETFVPGETRDEAARIEMTDFIDPAVAEPLIAVQDKIDRLARPRLENRRPPRIGR